MPIKECTGLETTNEVDRVLDEIEDQISAAKGKGAISEDKYDEIVNQFSSMREMNNKLKCMLAAVPSDTTSPESILQEVETEITGNKVSAEE